jgi:hypothetical protein
MTDVRALDRAHVDRDRVLRRRADGLMQERRARRHRLDRVEDGRQLLPLDLDGVDRRPRGRAGRRGDGGDHVAREAGHVAQDPLILELAAVDAKVVDIGGQQRGAALGQRARVDRAHARVRVWRAHERCVQHPRPLDVDRVALRTGDARVEPDRAHAASSSSARRTSTAVTRRR